MISSKPDEGSAKQDPPWMSSFRCWRPRCDWMRLDAIVPPWDFRFLISPGYHAVMLECPEPIDWTRLGCGPLTFVEDGRRTGLPTTWIYCSDLTRMILLSPTYLGLTTFQVGKEYLWTVSQYMNGLPSHSSSLQNWLTHRQEEHVLTLRIP